METSQNRIGWIDEYKGFVLLLVCLFHVEQSFSCIDMGMQHLSAFRMSAFFFISGVLFSTRRFKDFKSYALHKTKVLLLPYIMLSLLFLALDPVVWNFDLFPRAPKMTVMNIHPEIAGTWDYIYWNLAKIFVAGKSSIGSGPLWFVFTLYSISLMFFALQKLASLVIPATPTVIPAPEPGPPLTLSSRAPTRDLPLTLSSRAPTRDLPSLLIAAASFAGGWLLYRHHIRLPLGIERDLTCLGFFAMGYACKNLCRSTGFIKNLFIAIISFTLYAYFEKPNPWFSIMNNDLGKSALDFFASSLFGIVGLVFAFQLFAELPEIAPVKILKGILRNISRNALIILSVHWWALLILRIVFKPQLDKPYIAYCTIPIVAIVVIAAIPLFRCKFYKLIAKEKITAKESLSIR